MFLSLISGGMRAITGLIGRGSPNRCRVSGGHCDDRNPRHDVDVVTDGNTVAVTVSDGAVTFTFNGQTVVVTTGQGAFTANGKITVEAATAIMNDPALSQALQNALGSVAALSAAINMSTGVEGTRHETIDNGTSTTTNPTTPGTGSGGGGTTTVSSH